MGTEARDHEANAKEASRQLACARSECAALRSTMRQRKLDCYETRLVQQDIVERVVQTGDHLDDAKLRDRVADLCGQLEEIREALGALDPMFAPTSWPGS